jgi:hypothetical protein
MFGKKDGWKKVRCKKERERERERENLENLEFNSLIYYKPLNKFQTRSIRMQL